MSGGQEERKRILVLTYIETFSAGNAVTPVYLEMFFGRVEFILKSPSVFVGRFGAVGKTHKVHPVHFEEIGCQGLHVQSAGNADTEVSATYQFFGDVAPPTSLLPPALKALLTPTDCMTSVPKKSREIFLYSGSSEGREKPLKVVAL